MEGEFIVLDPGQLAELAKKQKNVPDRSCGWERGGEEWIDLQNTG